MYKRNLLLRLKKLKKSRVNQLQFFIENNRELSINNLYIDSVIASYDQFDNRLIIPEEDKEIIDKLNEKIGDEYYCLDSDERKYIYKTITKYKYSEEDNKKAIDHLVNNINRIFYKDIYSDKYNIAKTRCPSIEENAMVRLLTTTTIKYKCIDEQYINEVLDNFDDAVMLYNGKYFNQAATIESNNEFDDKRRWHLHFDCSNIPHIMGLPSRSDFLQTRFYQDLNHEINFECKHVIDYFSILSKYYRNVVINHEMNSNQKINWGKINVKTMAFKNFGDITYGPIVMYRKGKNKIDYFIEKECINKNIKDFVELGLVRKKGSRNEFLNVRSIRFSKSDREDDEDRIYLGLASNAYRSNLVTIMDSIKNNDNEEFEYYISINQEKLLQSAEMICARSKITDRILLSEMDLDYMFLSNDYENDSRLIADSQTKKLIDDFYRGLRREPIGLATFKQIYRLSKKVKLSEKDNANIKNRIKEKVYLEAAYTIEHARKYNADFLREHEATIKKLRKKYNKK